MKLRNKKTGVIGELVSNNRTLIYVDNVPKYEYNSLLDIYAEWEDYEETKDFWYLTGDGYIMKNNDNDKFNKDFVVDLKSIANYFETKEEVEKAVEKLKAWKRLKDKGFKFLWWLSTTSGDQADFYIPSDNFDKEAELDLNLLFGSGE